MDGRCATCKWWEKKDDVTRLYLDMGNCALTVVKNGDTPTHPGSKALAVDWESYLAKLMTAPDFGCVQWESKS